jgi:hypothetical protein
VATKTNSRGDVLMFRPKRRGKPDERTAPSVG